MPREADHSTEDPPSDRFEEAWESWPLKVDKDAAAKAWRSVVTKSQEKAAFACIGRYLASDQVGRGVVSKLANWLPTASRDKWTGDWPRLQSREARRAAEIDAQWAKVLQK